MSWLWNRGFRFLFVLDAVALYSLMVIISFVRFGFSFDWDTYPLSRYFVGFAIATVIHLIVNYFTGLYEREPRLGVRPWLPRALLATGIGVAVQGLAFVLLDRYLMPRLNLAVFLALASFVLVANRHLSRMLARRRQGAPRVVLVGESDSIDLAAQHLAETDRDATVVARVGSPNLLTDAVIDNQASDVLLMDVTAFGSVFPEPLNSLDSAGCRLPPAGLGPRDAAGAQDGAPGRRDAVHPLRPHTVPGYQVRLKRLFDLVVVVVVRTDLGAGAGAAGAVRAGRCRAGPCSTARLGSGATARVFDVRQVPHDGPRRRVRRSGPACSKDDDRVLPALRWMRSTRADELPQLWNVLRGEMSLVGPRPERPELVAEIEQDVAGYVRRNELPPGLTGLAQMNGRYETDPEYKLGYDLQYLVNWSIVIDVQILFRTVWVVLSRRV